MRPGQRIAGLGVVEVLGVDPGGFPVDGRMAERTAVAEAALVLVFMASGAIGRKPEPSVVQVLGRQQRTGRRCNMLRIVAGAAVDAKVLAVERIAGLCVVEALGRRIPVQQCEVFPVVIGVAFDAGCAGGSGAREGCMQAPVSLQFIGNFAVAFQTAEVGRTSGNFVAFDAIGRAIQVLMCSGEWSWRDLCMGHGAGCPEKTEEKRAGR